MTRLLIAIFGLTLALEASAQIYRCEGEGGVVEYSNSVSAGREARCRKVDLPEVTTIPTPKLPPKAAAGTSTGAATNAKSGGKDFPKVDPATQKARDSDRRRIIEDELRSEEDRLATLMAEYKGGTPDRRGDERNYQKYLERVERLKDDIARSEANVATLKRELDAIRN
jgi:hypothetical protein